VKNLSHLCILDKTLKNKYALKHHQIYKWNNNNNNNKKQVDYLSVHTYKIQSSKYITGIFIMC
jgi:hypothetical protein